MPTVWGIHNDQTGLDLVEGRFISIGWEELGDLRQIGHDRETLKQRLIEAYPGAKPGAIPVWAGVLHRFISEMKIGDFVVSPNKVDRTLNFGRVTSDFYVEESSKELHGNRRQVEWLRVGVPRAGFSPSALHEIGSAITLFRIKTHAAEFLGALTATREVEGPLLSDQAAVDLAEEEPNAERVDSYSRDFVIQILQRVDHSRFEHFVAGVLTAMGYRAAATQASGDGGVDVIASRDALGLEPPIVKVQCKRSVATVGAELVQKLIGALSIGGSELALFVTLGGYSNDARHIERTRGDLRLLNGTQLTNLIFEHYENLDPEWKRMLPLRRVYAVDRDAGGV